MSKKNPWLLRYSLLAALVTASGGLLLYTSQSVQGEKARLASIEKSIQREEQMIRVLEAEWARLNSPYNLEELTQHYLDLVPPDTAYIAPELPELPKVEQIAIPDSAVQDNKDLKLDAVASEAHVRPSKKPSPPVKSLQNNEGRSLQDVMKRLQGGDT